MDFLEEWAKFWLPIYKRQVFKAKCQNDISTILSIKDNIHKNIHFTNKEKIKLYKTLGIYRLS